MGELGNFFVTIGSKFQSGGFDKARASINKVATAGIAMGAALSFAGLKAAQAAGIQEKAEFTLAEAMKVAGTFTEEAHQHNLDYAASLQTMTEFGDEAILGVQKMLTNFGVEGEMLDKLTKATLDLAAAKGMDLRSAADLVSKSVGSTTNALTRYGIAVEGDVGSTERMQMAVDNISKLFGGAAEANAKTYLGAISQLKNIIGDLWEDIGFKLIPIILDYVKIIKSNILPKVKEWIDESGNIESVIKRVTAIIKFVTKTTYSFAKIIDFTIQSIKIANNTLLSFNARIAQVGSALTGNFSAAKKFGDIARAASDKAKKGYDKLKDSVVDAGETIKEMNALELESYRTKEEGKTEILTEQTNIQNELADADAEIDQKRKDNQAINDQNRLETMSNIKKEIDENDDKREKELHERRMQRVRQFATVVTDALSIIEHSETITWANVAKAYGSAIKQMIGYIIKQLVAEKIKAIAVAAMNTTITFGAAAYQIGAVIAAATAAMAGLSAIKNFDQGGIVPGRIGQPQLAIVHGGEEVIPTNAVGSARSSFIFNITVPPITSRRVADEYGERIGESIFRKLNRTRRT